MSEALGNQDKGWEPVKPAHSGQAESREKALAILRVLQLRMNRAQDKVATVLRRLDDPVDAYRKKLVAARREYNLSSSKSSDELSYKNFTESLGNYLVSQEGIDPKSRKFQERFHSLETGILTGLRSDELSDKVQAFTFSLSLNVMADDIYSDGLSYRDILNASVSDLAQANKEFKKAKSAYGLAKQYLKEKKALNTSDKAAGESDFKKGSSEVSLKNHSLEGGSKQLSVSTHQTGEVGVISYANGSLDYLMDSAEAHLSQKRREFDLISEEMSLSLLSGKDTLKSESNASELDILKRYSEIGTELQQAKEECAQIRSALTERNALQKPVGAYRNIAIAAGSLGAVGVAVLTPILMGAIACPPAGVIAIAVGIAALLVTAVALGITSCVKSRKVNQKTKALEADLLPLADRVNDDCGEDASMKEVVGNQIAQDRGFEAEEDSGDCPSATV